MDCAEAAETAETAMAAAIKSLEIRIMFAPAFRTAPAVDAQEIPDMRQCDNRRKFQSIVRSRRKLASSADG
jgi:hypothetical protein